MIKMHSEFFLIFSFDPWFWILIYCFSSRSYYISQVFVLFYFHRKQKSHTLQIPIIKRFVDCYYQNGFMWHHQINNNKYTMNSFIVLICVNIQIWIQFEACTLSHRILFIYNTFIWYTLFTVLIHFDPTHT